VAARAAGAEAAQPVIPISKYALHFDPNARIVDAVLHPATTFQQANGAYVQELIGAAAVCRRNDAMDDPRAEKG